MSIPEFIILLQCVILSAKGHRERSGGQLFEGLSYLNHVSPAKAADKGLTFCKLGVATFFLTVSRLVR
jgi:hypothetical protein